MRYYSVYPVKNASKSVFNVFELYLLYTFILILSLCPGCNSDDSLLDLSNCTQIEIKYYPSTLDYFLRDNLMYTLNVLSTDEKEYIKSLKTFTILDPKLIKTFSDYLLKGTYTGRMEGRIPYATPVYINCYHNKKLITSLMVIDHKIIVDENRVYGNYEHILEIIEPNELTPFRLRGSCVHNLVRIYNNIFLQAKETMSYPKPEQWCDNTVKELQARWLDKEDILKVFQCPGAGEGKNHYAMNPNCEPNSPGDMVLLFETKAGWNQHGGPKLFTFDNHDPKGGCVLLNDGIVKFIRTQEELHALKWK